MQIAVLRMTGKKRLLAEKLFWQDCQQHLHKSMGKGHDSTPAECTKDGITVLQLDRHTSASTTALYSWPFSHSKGENPTHCFQIAGKISPFLNPISHFQRGYMFLSLSYV